MRCTAQSASFRSKGWTIGWGVAVVAFALHVAALTLAPISVGQAVLARGLVFLAVLADRFFGMQLGRRQWIALAQASASLAGWLTAPNAPLLPAGGGAGPGHVRLC